MCFVVHCVMFNACDAPVVISCQLIMRVEKSFSTEHLLAKKLALFYCCSHLLRPNHSPLAESLVWKSYFFNMARQPFIRNRECADLHVKRLVSCPNVLLQSFSILSPRWKTNIQSKYFLIHASRLTSITTAPFTA